MYVYFNETGPNDNFLLSSLHNIEYLVENQSACTTGDDGF